MRRTDLYYKTNYASRFPRRNFLRQLDVIKFPVTSNIFKLLKRNHQDLKIPFTQSYRKSWRDLIRKCDEGKSGENLYKVSQFRTKEMQRKERANLHLDYGLERFHYFFVSIYSRSKPTGDDGSWIISILPPIIKRKY